MLLRSSRRTIQPVEPTPGIEPGTSSLPRKCSTPELCGRCQNPPSALERVMGIEPTSSAWKAEVLPLNYTRHLEPCNSNCTTLNPSRRPFFRDAKTLTVFQSNRPDSKNLVVPSLRWSCQPSHTPGSVLCLAALAWYKSGQKTKPTNAAILTSGYLQRSHTLVEGVGFEPT